MVRLSGDVLYTIVHMIAHYYYFLTDCELLPGKPPVLLYTIVHMIAHYYYFLTDCELLPGKPPVHRFDKGWEGLGLEGTW